MNIEDINDVDKISKKNTNNVIFDLSFLSTQENEEWSRKFNRLLSDCGCSTGQRYLFFLLPLIFIVFVLLLIFSSLSYIIIFFLFISVNIVTGILGKIVGIKKRNRKINELIVNFYKKNSFNV